MRSLFLFIRFSAYAQYIYKELNGTFYREHIWEIKKGDDDQKDYRGLVLDNQLEILVVTDPNARKAGASLVVSSGSRDDPRDIPGLAHLCEHILHMGSAKYPNASTYSDYVNDNGGAFSATTYYNHTSYRFQVNPEALDGALDIFAHLFIEPMMDRDKIEREINAVQSEYEYRQQKLAYKVNQVLSAVMDVDHPYTRFSMGNRRTLVTEATGFGSGLYEQARKHYYKYYSANMMKLVVVSPSPPDQVERMVVPRFTRILNYRARPEPAASPFQPTHLATDILMNPNLRTNEMVIQFVLPPLHHIAQQLAFDYVSYYLTRSDAGSLLDSHLKKGNLQEIQAELSEQNSGFAIYRISFSLTDTLKVDEITADMFAYLQAIREQGLTEERHAEFKAIARSKRTIHPIAIRELATKLAENLHFGTPIRNIGLGHGDMAPFNSSVIAEAIRMLSLFSMRRVVISHIIAAARHEPWFNSNYSVTQLSQYFVGKVTSRERQGSLPNIKQIPPKQPNKDAPRAVRLVHEDPTTRLWHMGGTSLFEPSRLSLAFIDVRSPLTSLEMVRMTLLVKLVKGKLNKIRSSILSEGEGVELRPFNNKLVLQLQAFDLQASLGLLLDEIQHMDFIPKEFMQARKTALDRLAKFNSSSPVTQAHYLVTSAIQWDEVPIDTHERLLRKMDFTSFENWFHRLLNCHRIDGLLVGQDDVRPILEKIKLFQSGLGNCSRKFRHAREISFSGENVYQLTANSANSAVAMYLDLYSSQEAHDSALAALATSIIKSRFRNKIRTQEQLGYMIDVMPLKRSGGGGLIFVLQSNKQPYYLESRIEAFLEEFVARVEAMCTAAFIAKRQALLSSRQIKQPTLSEIQNLYWPAILNNDLDFLKGNPVWYCSDPYLEERETANLKMISKQQLVVFLKLWFLRRNGHRRKLSVQLWLPSQKALRDTNATDAQGLGAVLPDLQAWKRNSLDL